ncbi:MAG: aminotransferase class V-fold PLP-dependent enzyme [Myxococcales bacterium]|nr:aminotransferase class V-fold PLP-dependent enzyme [Myxococcales bacterium]
MSAISTIRLLSPDESPWRGDFPFLVRRDGAPCYLDSAAMTLKPACVVDAVCSFYRDYGTHIYGGHRAIGQRAAAAFDAARAKVARLLGARPSEIVFTHNCSAALNLVAVGLGLSYGDEIIVSRLEHEANVLPWHRGQVRVCEVTPDGRIDLDHLASLLGPRTRVIAVTMASNVSGVVQPIADITALARERRVLTVVDAAQCIVHQAIDVDALGCDFLAFSGAKAFGPSGVGVLYGREQALAQLDPLAACGSSPDAAQAGTCELEAGTPNLEGVIGLGAAIDYLQAGGEAMRDHTAALGEYLRHRLSEQGLVQQPFASDARALPMTSVLPRGGIGTSRLTALLYESFDIIVRDGTHGCAPLFERVALDSALRISLAPYNQRSDVDTLVDALAELCPEDAS